MDSGKYMAYSDELGKMITVSGIDESLAAIKKRVKDYEKRIEYLEGENEKLKLDNYKDTELSEMQARLDKMKADYFRGFPITEEESNKIKNWISFHEREKHGFSEDHPMKISISGGRYSYHFLPTSLGVSGKIRCSCGAELVFQDIG
jgi:hypothetical protein